ncbi:MFS transporter [Streptomyces brevispora]|uniref:Putative proline/betaine transporter n=1 Tax=Streptomyces brevispora TaxID=887462 RepID=A0A561UY03_9ACTN|nr:MFS transporter [Streptomyces brevispora]TWG04229.1 sugar phosphate permease [Streptomyces brevispora]WSC14715.1 MHS family MFS transporter [Streptomyces brevispora]
MRASELDEQVETGQPVAASGGAEDGSGTPAARRAVVSGALGSALEWFDFSVYGALSATVFPQLFFPELAPGTALLASFATFGVGLVARPLGGLLFGRLGDRLGRRNVLMVTLLLMGVASVLIGLLPTYASVGILAPAALVTLRFLQGFALGGELTGSQLMVMEHSPNRRRGIAGALMSVGSPISQVLATLSLTGLAAWLTEEQFNGWGWRVPFLMSVALIAVGYYIRHRVEETPAFLASEGKSEQPARGLLKQHRKTVTLLVLAWAAPGALYYIMVTFATSYLTGELGFDKSSTFGLMVVANTISIGASLLGGWSSDRIGRKRVLFTGLAILLAFLIPFFLILNTGNWWMAALAITGALCGVQFMTGCQGAFYAEALPTPIRYTGSALGLTCGNMIFAAPAPFLATWLMQSSDNGTALVTGYGLLTILVSAVAIRLLPDRTGRQLEA